MAKSHRFGDSSFCLAHYLNFSLKCIHISDVIFSEGLIGSILFNKVLLDYLPSNHIVGWVFARVAGFYCSRNVHVQGDCSGGTLVEKVPTLQS